METNHCEKALQRRTSTCVLSFMALSMGWNAHSALPNNSLLTVILYPLVGQMLCRGCSFQSSSPSADVQAGHKQGKSNHLYTRLVVYKERERVSIH